MIYARKWPPHDQHPKLRRPREGRRHSESFHREAFPALVPSRDVRTVLEAAGQRCSRSSLRRSESRKRKRRSNQKPRANARGFLLSLLFDLNMQKSSGVAVYFPITLFHDTTQYLSCFEFFLDHVSDLWIGASDWECYSMLSSLAREAHVYEALGFCCWITHTTRYDVTSLSFLFRRLLRCAAELSRACFRRSG